MKSDFSVTNKVITHKNTFLCYKKQRDFFWNYLFSSDIFKHKIKDSKDKKVSLEPIFSTHFVPLARFLYVIV